MKKGCSIGVRLDVIWTRRRRPSEPTLRFRGLAITQRDQAKREQGLGVARVFQRNALAQCGRLRFVSDPQEPSRGRQNRGLGHGWGRQEWRLRRSRRHGDHAWLEGRSIWLKDDGSDHRGWHIARMNLLWILSGPLEHRKDGLYSPYGSHRLRALLPARALGRLGHRVSVLQGEHLADKLESPILKSMDAVIVAKQFTDISPALRRVKEEGVRIVVDVCDDVFALDHLRGLYADLLDLADLCIAASPVLAERIAAHHAVHGRRTSVLFVPDCVEGGAESPRFRPASDQPLRLLWFGQPANLDALEEELPELGDMASRHPMVLSVVTKVAPSVLERFSNGRCGLPIRCLPWSPEVMRAALDWCDLVIVPSAATGDKLVKSSNRVATALWAGRMPVAFPLPSYHALADAAILSERAAIGIQQALADPVAMEARIVQGQALIDQTFSPTAVASCWQAALASSFPIADEMP